MEENILQKEKPSVLIVEDDFDSQEFLRILLSRKFKTLLCDSENSFYPLIENYKIDVILMDISLKGKKNGLELIQELKNKSRYRYIPIVCFTAHAFGQDRINALQAGADIFLAKPVNNSILLNAIESLLNKREAALI